MLFVKRTKTKKMELMLPNLHFLSRPTCKMRHQELYWGNHQGSPTAFPCSRHTLHLSGIPKPQNFLTSYRDNPSILFPGLLLQSKVWAREPSCRCHSKGKGIGEHRPIAMCPEIWMFPWILSFPIIYNSKVFSTKSGHGAFWVFIGRDWGSRAFTALNLEVASTWVSSQEDGYGSHSSRRCRWSPESWEVDSLGGTPLQWTNP